MSTPTGPAFSAYIGLDWADAKHDFCLQPGDAGEREFGRFAHKPDQIDAWARGLKDRFGGTIAVALELTKGPIVYALQKYDFIVLFPVNPSLLAKYREAFKPSHAKDDPTDAEFALDLMLRYPQQCVPLHPQSVAMRTLGYLVEQRRRLVDDRKRTTNRIGDALKQYFPQVLDWFERRDTLVFCDFLTRWPMLVSSSYINLDRLRDGSCHAGVVHRTWSHRHRAPPVTRRCGPFAGELFVRLDAQ